MLNSINERLTIEWKSQLWPSRRIKLQRRICGYQKNRSSRRRKHACAARAPEAADKQRRPAPTYFLLNLQTWWGHQRELTYSHDSAFVDIITFSRWQPTMVLNLPPQSPPRPSILFFFSRGEVTNISYHSRPILFLLLAFSKKKPTPRFLWPLFFSLHFSSPNLLLGWCQDDDTPLRRGYLSRIHITLIVIEKLTEHQ